MLLGCLARGEAKISYLFCQYQLQISSNQLRVAATIPWLYITLLLHSRTWLQWNIWSILLPVMDVSIPAITGDIIIQVKVCYNTEAVNFNQNKTCDFKLIKILFWCLTTWPGIPSSAGPPSTHCWGDKRAVKSAPIKCGGRMYEDLKPLLRRWVC